MENKPLLFIKSPSIINEDNKNDFSDNPVITFLRKNIIYLKKVIIYQNDSSISGCVIDVKKTRLILNDKENIKEINFDDIVRISIEIDI